MLCQRCKKRTETYHLTEVIKSEMHEKHLCDQCAAKEGEVIKAQEPLDELVKKFVLAHASSQEVAQLTCPECGMTFMQFKTSGLLGCPNDYEVFKEPLLALLERAHGGRTQHVAKVPGGKENKHKRQHEVMRLKRELDEAVAVEDYERAASLRDEMVKLEDQ